MKKLTALLLILTLLALCVVPAFADSDIPADGYVPKREWRLIHGRGAYYLNQSSDYNESWSEGNYSGSYKGTITYDATFGGDKLVQLVYTNKFDDTYVSPDGKEHWSGSEKLTMTSSGQPIAYERTDDQEGKTYKYTYDGKAWHDEKGNEVTMVGIDEWGKDLMKDYEPEFKWYNNTVCLLGLPIRDLKPSLTDKWYTIVPVDLTKDAVYTYPMIAGSIYYVGECQVTVKDGQVTTHFSIPEGLCYDKRHCLQWFTSLDDITPEFLNNLNAGYTFGQPVSIADDLKGQDVGILFICNQLQYHIPFSYSGKGFPTRYYSGQDFVRAAQADMRALLAKIQK